jgi:hypothetical protein
MPQAVFSAILKVAGTVAYAAAYATGSVAAGYVAGTFFAAAAIGGSLYALNKITLSLIGIPKVSKPRNDVEFSGTVEPRRIVYGENLVAGMNVIPPMTSGTNNEFLHQVLAVAGHECNQLGTIYFNRSTIGTISAITGSVNDGKVTTGTYNGKAWVRRYTGTITQTVDWKLSQTFPTQWTTNHRGRGVAYIALTYQFDETVYKTGKPEVTCLVQGKKVYDPRLDSTRTGGSGSQRVDDPTTWAYSTNPALCLADYLLDNKLGLGESDDKIDYDLVMDAADICDELVNIPGSLTQKRYTCNVILIATDRFEENIQVLAQAMAGVCYYSGGKWRMYAGAWSSSAFTLGDNDLIEGGLSVTTAYPYNQRYNSVRGQFINKDRNWQPMEYQPVINNTYITEDGEQIWFETDFAACTNEYEAQRHAILISRRSRNGQVATVRCGLSAYKIRPFETGTVTFSEIGWTNKTVRCEGWKFDPSGAVDLILREEASTNWTDPATGDYEAPTSVTDPTPTDYKPLSASGLTAKNLTSGFNLSWTAPAVFPVGAVYEIWEHTSITPFSSASKVWTGNTTSVFISKTDTTTRYYWVVVRSKDGVASDEFPIGNGVAAGAASISTTLAASSDPSSLSKTDSGASITSANTTVTATGGTTPYTYSWVRTSGSALISANSASAATTSFTGTTLASGTTYEALFTCTVTDNVAATATATVTVSLTRTGMSASASPSTLYELSTNANITSDNTTVTPTGGVAPYTYSWAKVSGDTLTLSNASAATTNFSKNGIPEWEFVSALYRCTVTDSSSPALTATADVDVTLEREGSGPPP